LGSGVLSAPVVASALPEPTPSSGAGERGGEPATRENIARLVHPLAQGARFARWTVAQIDPLVNGGVTIKVRTDDGHCFDLEILGRDRTSLAQRPPAQTERHAIFVVNGGDGWAPTHEEQGLAAMTLAQIVAKNEGSVRLAGFFTHAERIQHHREALLVPAPRPVPST
jgi:hypothetical protein